MKTVFFQTIQVKKKDYSVQHINFNLKTDHLTLNYGSEQ